MMSLEFTTTYDFGPWEIEATAEYTSAEHLKSVSYTTTDYDLDVEFLKSVFINGRSVHQLITDKLDVLAAEFDWAGNAAACAADDYVQSQLEAR